MNVAICDDSIGERAIIVEHLHTYFPELSISEYSNGADLVHAHKSKPFTLVFLDVLMPGLNGIETAERIRVFDKNTPIIFVTTTEEFAVQSYRVAAFDYLVKPVTAEAMEQCLIRFTKLTPDKRSISVGYRGVRTNILLKNIMYLESELRKVIIHLFGGKELRITAKLGDFTELLEEIDFCRCHKSFIINLNAVETISSEGFCLSDGRRLRISRTFSSSAKKAYFDYVFGKGGA